MAECNNASDEEESSRYEEQRIIDQAPFRNFRITDPRILNTLKGRIYCKSCYKSRKFFCYTCYTPVIDQRYFPRLKLPIKIDIIKHVREIAGKSTAIHAAILAPDDVTIYTYPDFPEVLNNEETVLIFPSKKGNLTVEDLFTERQGKTDISTERGMLAEFPIKRAIFIDSTWQQAKSIRNDKRLRELRCVVLKSRISQFWRHQKNSPRWFLATIEAIHHFLVEMHICAFGIVEKYADLDNSVSDKEQDLVINDERVNECVEVDRRYNGQYDNLLYFFKYMYNKIHSMYDHKQLLAYKRPIK